MSYFERLAEDERMADQSARAYADAEPRTADPAPLPPPVDNGRDTFERYPYRCECEEARERFG